MSSPLSVVVFGPTHADIVQGGDTVDEYCSVRAIDPIEVGPILRKGSDGYEVRLLMDKFLVVLPLTTFAERQAVHTAFFSWLAPQYERSIDASRNCENVRILLGLLGRSEPSTILDFGCGTGITFDEVRKRGHRLIGVDSCPTMRRIAAARGVEVYPPDFDGKPVIFGGIISSYVFHYGPDGNSLLPSWSRLESGGVLAANVHKGLGLSDCVTIIESLGGHIKSVGPEPKAERHGIYVVAQKH